MKSRKAIFRSVCLPYFAAALFLIILGLCLLAMRYGHAFGVNFSADVMATVIIWICSLLLLLTGGWLGFSGRDKYLRLLQVNRRRAAARSRAVYETRIEKGLHITAIGGGTGLSTILRGLKEISGHINAVVTVTDDGGSSGRLLEGNMVVPPGDIRNCLVALSSREGIMEELFNYRFESPPELKGHSLGNLMISGLTDLTGDTATAVRDIGRILNIRGNVIPVTLDDVCLGATMNDGVELFGETTIVADSRRIKRVFLRPGHALVNADAIDAIIGADVVLLGPGSLYTSIIPNLLVPGIIDALVQTEAPVWYVANIMTQAGETEGYNLSAHIEAIASLSLEPFIKGVIINTSKISPAMALTYRKNGLAQVENDMAAVKKYGLRVVGLPLSLEEGYVKHDATVLADFIASGKF